MSLGRNILTSSSIVYRRVAEACRRKPRRTPILPEYSRLHFSSCAYNPQKSLWRRDVTRGQDGPLILRAPSASSFLTGQRQTRGCSSSNPKPPTSLDVCSHHSHDEKGSVSSDAKNPTIKTEPSKKLFLSFTCKVCNGSNSYLISKKAYNHGVVIVTCNTCSSHHLIADHLDWFPQSGGGRTIEEILAEKGEKVTKFMSTEVKEILPEEENSEEGNCR